MGRGQAAGPGSRAFVAGGSRARRELGVIAINPSCETLIRQLLAYQLKDPDQGRVLKKDDHGPDALIAGMARRAAHHRTLIDQET